MTNQRWRRAAYTAALLVLIAACASPAQPAAQENAQPSATAVTQVTALVIRSSTCSCCHEHEAYMRAAGMHVQSVIQDDLRPVKAAYGVPIEMTSCHTSDIGGYFVEGHVPMGAIEKLLAEQPDIDGIALPGMPAGSPGMGGVQEGPLVVFAVKDGDVVGEFASF